MTKILEKTLKIAVQKSDRIANDFLDLMKDCGLNTYGVQKKLYCKIAELPIELYFVRGSDIPSLLQNQFDLAVLGEDSFLEYKLDKITNIAKRLNFAKCHLSFAGKNINKNNFNLTILENKNIATTYTSILQNFLDTKKISANIVKMNGSVETSIELGFADFIFDIVQTGSTLFQQGLIECQRILNLEALLIVKNGFSSQILTKLLTRINAVLLGKQQKYIMFNLKKELLTRILPMLPSANSPTILNLANSDYVAIHTLCEKTKIWEICEQLKAEGAEGIIINDVGLMF